MPKFFGRHLLTITPGDVKQCIHTNLRPIRSPPICSNSFYLPYLRRPANHDEDCPPAGGGSSLPSRSAEKHDSTLFTPSSTKLLHLITASVGNSTKAPVQLPESYQAFFPQRRATIPLPTLPLLPFSSLQELQSMVKPNSKPYAASWKSRASAVIIA